MNKYVSFIILLASLFGLSQPVFANEINSNGYYTFSMYNIRVRLPDSITPVSAKLKEFGDNSIDIDLPGKASLGGGKYTVMIKDGSRLDNQTEFYKVWIPAIKDFINHNEKLNNGEFKIKTDKKLEINDHPAYQIVAVDNSITNNNNPDTYVVTAIFNNNNVIITSKLSTGETDVDFFAPFETDKQKLAKTITKEQKTVINSDITYYNFVQNIIPYIAHG